MIRLVDCEEEPDAEEERLRAILERERREQREQEALELQRRGREAAEAEAAARAAAEEKEHHKSALQLRQHLHESAQASQVHYRIAQGPSPSRGSTTPAHSSKASSTSGASQRRSLPGRCSPHGSGPARKRPGTPDINIPELEPDYFQPLEVTQPAMFDAMKLAPGVSMAEKERSKAAPTASSKVQMTRKEYLKLCDPERVATPSATPSGSANSGLNAGMESSSAAPDGQPADDLAFENSQWLGSNSSMCMGAGHSRSMGFVHPSMRMPRERKPTAGMRDFLHKSLRPTAGGLGRCLMSDAGNDSASIGPGAVRCKPGNSRLRAVGSCGSLGNGGKIVANRDLLQQMLLANVR